MEQISAKRVAKVKLTLNKRTVEALRPEDKSWIAWDDRLTGFGCRVMPSGTKAFIVNYRAGDGGRKAPNKRIVIGRYGRMAPDKARRIAQDMLGRAARGEDPAGERAEARGMPTLAQAFEDYMAANPNRAADTVRLYRRNLRVNLGDWLKRPLDSISRQEVEERFNRITDKHGWAGANQTLSMLRSIYRRPCVDHEGLRNPVELWLAGGGRFNRQRRPAPQTPAGVRVRPGALPPPCRPGVRPGSGLFTPGVPFPAFLPTGKSRISQVPRRPIPVTLRRSTTPDDPLRPATGGASGAAPTRVNNEGVIGSDFEACRAASSPAVYASRRASPLAMQGSLPAGGMHLCRAGVEPAGSLRDVSVHVIPPPGLTLAQ